MRCGESDVLASKAGWDSQHLLTFFTHDKRVVQEFGEN
jgi:hypothetical protein